MDNNLIKISFTGDIMCESLQIESHKLKNNIYNFDEIFNDSKVYFDKSNYIVANLETPIGSASLGYSNKKFSFNTPEEFLLSLKKLGVSLVTTANNHCLDRGIKGLQETILNLDKYKLQHIGTYSNNHKKGFIQDINGIKVGFLSYTYGTNAFNNKYYLKRKEKYMVNLFQEQELNNPIVRKCYGNNKLYARIFNKIHRIVLPEQSKVPIYERKEKNKRCMNNLKKEIDDIKKQGADYIIMCMHMGGQYNSEPTKRTIDLVEKLIELGVNAVIGNHEHVIHKCDLTKLKDNIIKTYSLGNFSGLAGVLKGPYDKMAEYSIIFNIYLEKKDNITNVEKCSFSIAKSICIEDGKIKTEMLYDLINNSTDKYEKNKLINDNLKIYNLFLNKNVDTIELKREYFIRSIKK